MPILSLTLLLTDQELQDIRQEGNPEPEQLAASIDSFNKRGTLMHLARALYASAQNELYCPAEVLSLFLSACLHTLSHSTASQSHYMPYVIPHPMAWECCHPFA